MIFSRTDSPITRPSPRSPGTSPIPVCDRLRRTAIEIAWFVLRIRTVKAKQHLGRAAAEKTREADDFALVQFDIFMIQQGLACITGYRRDDNPVRGHAPS